MALVAKYQGAKGLISFLTKRFTRGIMSRKKKKWWNRHDSTTVVVTPFTRHKELKQRVIFVDINGTLTSQKTVTETKKWVLSRLAPGETPEQTVVKERVWAAQRESIDPACVELLKEFAKKNNAAVVICSTSRGGSQGDFVEKVLRDYAIKIGPFLPFLKL